MATSTAIPDLDRLRPAGTKRSSKRDLIVNAFLKQEGHLSADDLVDVIKREDHRISRATVYRTLQWMVDAGIARKVDFGEGRFRFEHSYRHPRHFHLICKTCHRSFEFLSSDIESLVEEVAVARRFNVAQSVVQIYGACEDCQAGRTVTAHDGHTDLVFARDALRIAIATERSGLEFYTRAARVTKDAQGRNVIFSSDGTSGRIYKIDLATDKVVGWAQTSLGRGEDDAGRLIHEIGCKDPNVVYLGSAILWNVTKVTIAHQAMVTRQPQSWIRIWPALPSIRSRPPWAVAPAAWLASPRTWTTPDIMFSATPTPALPPMTTVASGRCTWLPMPCEIAAGNSPTPAESAVISMGRIRCSAP